MRRFQFVSGKAQPPAMISSVIVRIVDYCARFRWTVVIAGTILMLATAAFDFAQFRSTRMWKT